MDIPPIVQPQLDRADPPPSGVVLLNPKEQERAEAGAVFLGSSVVREIAGGI
jgi:hypothetical protein